MDGLTPPASPLPDELDLRDGEKFAKGVWGKRYLVGKRQEIIVVTEYLNGHRIVLHEGITSEAFARFESAYPGCHPAKGGGY